MKITKTSLKATIVVAIVALLFQSAYKILLFVYVYGLGITSDNFNKIQPIYLLGFVPIMLLIYIWWYFKIFLHEVIGSHRFDIFVWLFIISNISLLGFQLFFYLEVSEVYRISHDNVRIFRLLVFLIYLLILIVDIVFFFYTYNNHFSVFRKEVKVFSVFWLISCISPVSFLFFPKSLSGIWGLKWMIELVIVFSYVGFIYLFSQALKKGITLTDDYSPDNILDSKDIV